MRILLVSRSWPSSERSGVSLAAAAHVQMLAELGHEVSIAGAFAPVLAEALPVGQRFLVPSRGSGALYSPARVDRSLLTSAMTRTRVDLVVVEAWQTALTDAAVDAACELALPVLMVSHGVSLHPFSASWPDRLRAWGWTAYRLRRLPRLVGRLSALTALCEHVASPRFYDRDLASQMGTPVAPLGNFPIHWSAVRPSRLERKRQLLVVGYFSPIKNQLGALDVLRRLPPDISLRFVGQRRGAYYAQCVRQVHEMGLATRVTFTEDHECDLAEEIGGCIAVLSTSITEALPICLLEAMASGTPFVARPVGAVPALGAGLVRPDAEAQAEAVLDLVNDATLWDKLSSDGLVQYEARYSRARVRAQLAAAVTLAHDAGPRRRTPCTDHESKRL